VRQSPTNKKKVGRSERVAQEEGWAMSLCEKWHRSLKTLLGKEKFEGGVEKEESLKVPERGVQLGVCREPEKAVKIPVLHSFL